MACGETEGQTGIDGSERRNMTKGQKAMWLAMLYPEPEKGGRGKLSEISDGLGVSHGHAKNLLSQARAVLRHDQELARSVLAGAKSLDKALAEMKERAEADAKPEARIAANAVALCAHAPKAVIEIGAKPSAKRRHLIEAKERVGHGQFLAWVEGEFAWSSKSAERYIDVAKRMPNSSALTNFTNEALYLLAGPSVPEFISAAEAFGTYGCARRLSIAPRTASKGRSPPHQTPRPTRGVIAAAKPRQNNFLFFETPFLKFVHMRWRRVPPPMAPPLGWCPSDFSLGLGRASRPDPVLGCGQHERHRRRSVPDGEPAPERYRLADGDLGLRTRPCPT